MTSTILEAVQITHDGSRVAGLGGYGTGATNAVLAAVSAVQPTHRLGGSTGVIVVGEDAFRKELQLLRSEGAGASPRRFAEASPSTMAGAIADVFGIKGPSVVLTMSVTSATSVVAFYVASWLTESTVDRVLVCTHRWSADGDHRVEVVVHGETR